MYILTPVLKTTYTNTIEEEIVLRNLVINCVGTLKSYTLAILSFLLEIVTEVFFVSVIVSLDKKLNSILYILGSFWLENLIWLVLFPDNSE